MHIKINDWDKFNPRKDRANHSWFRLENTFFTKMYSFTSGQRELFIYLCTLKTRSSDEYFDFDISLACALLKAKSRRIFNDLKELSKHGLIENDSQKTPRGNRSVSSRLTTNVTLRTNVTNERNVTATLSNSFESIWSNYPRKISKTEAKARFVKFIKEGDIENFKKAVENYAKDCERLGTQEKYIKHMSSFIGIEEKQGWKDWINFTPTKIKNNADKWLEMHEKNGTT